MNQQIPAAIKLASSLPPPSTSEPPDHDFEALVAAPHTLASIGAALATCPHPARCQVEGVVVSDGQTEPIAWCAACGAMAIGAPLPHWERPAIVQQLTSAHFDEIAALRDIGCRISGGRVLDALELMRQAFAGTTIEETTKVTAGALADLASLRMFADLKRTEHARNVLALREAFADPVGLPVESLAIVPIGGNPCP